MSQPIVNPETKTLRSLLGNSILYKVPPYQRSYAWGEEEWTDLWEDLKALGRDHSEQHYMGYVVLKERSKREFLVVDGQQRLATLSILILAAADCIADKALSKKLLESYLKSESITSLIPQSRLKLNKTDDPFYRRNLLEFHKPVAVSRLPKSQKKMWQAFEYFKTSIKSEFGDNDKGIAEFIDLKTGDGLVFTVLYVESDEAAFTIFETLNARGVELSSPDLLKNRLFSIVHGNTGSEEEIKELEVCWQGVSDVLRSENMTTFLRHYWNSKAKETARKSNLYRAVRKKLDVAEKVFPFLRDMRDAADVYVEMRNPHRGEWDPVQQRHLSELVLYKASQHYPLLLAAFKAWGGNREFTRVAGYCAVVIFRRCVVGGLNPNSLEGVFAEAAAALRGGAQRADDLLHILQPVYLDDESFKVACNKMTLSPVKKKLAEHILFAIEKQWSGGDYSQDSRKYSLEHIFPQNPGDGWTDFEAEDEDFFLWRLGNLTLLDSKRNRQAANDPYAKKCSVYADSRFQITKDCAERYAEWTPATIEQRQRKLASAACGIWRISFENNSRVAE